jgi:hypothetical protein
MAGRIRRRLLLQIKGLPAVEIVVDFVRAASQRDTAPTAGAAAANHQTAGDRDPIRGLRLGGVVHPNPDPHQDSDAHPKLDPSRIPSDSSRSQSGEVVSSQPHHHSRHHEGNGGEGRNIKRRVDDVPGFLRRVRCSR